MTLKYQYFSTHSRFSIAFFFLPVILLIIPCFADARDNNWLGSFSYRPSYDSNAYNTGNDKKSELTSTFLPSLLLTSQGKTDTLEFNYAPNILWNHRREVYDVVQNFSLEAEKDFLSGLNMNFREDFNYFDISPEEFIFVQTLEMRFIIADDYYRREVARILFPEIVWSPEQMAYVLSQLRQRYNEHPEYQAEVDGLLTRDVDGERRRYWRNGISWQTEYEFDQDSILTFGYNLDIMKDISARLPDTDASNPYISLNYRFTERWRAEASYDFIRTNFNVSPDTTDHISYLQIDFQPGRNDRIFGRYSFSYLNYDEGPSDQNEKEGELGWDHAVDSRTDIGATFNYLYLERETSSDERGIGIDLTFSRILQQGIVSLAGSSEFAEGNSSGNWENLRESWLVRGDISYELLQDLTSTIRANYRKQLVWANNIKNTYNYFGGGVGFSYALGRWYSLSLDYSYDRMNTDTIGVDDYDKHQMFFGITAFWGTVSTETARERERRSGSGRTPARGGSYGGGIDGSL